VRSENVQEGSHRLKQNYREYIGDTGYPAERVIPVPGDLEKPRLGLSAHEFDMLAATADTIFHSGAYVNWLYPYSKLKPANVLGTQEILRLACHSKTKPVHFISTMAVFSLIAGTTKESITENESLDHARVLYGGYCQSKWVAEKLVQIARSRGLPVAIYRPGLVAGDSHTGASNTDDVLSKIMRSWVEAGSAPEMDASTDMTPVDYVSSAIAYLSRSPKSLGQVFHLFNPQPVQISAISAAIKSMGFQLRELDYDQWRSKMSALTTVKNRGSLSSLAPFFEDRGPSDSSGKSGQSEWQSDNTLDALGILFTTQPAKFDARRTLEALSGSSIVCPAIDAEILKSYFSFFVRKGLLRQAAASGQP
jgi:thioester reductase-like protein